MSVNKDKLILNILKLGTNHELGLAEFFDELVAATEGDKKTAWKNLMLEVPIVKVAMDVCINILDYGGIERVRETCNNITGMEDMEKDPDFENILLKWQNFVKIINCS